MRKNYFLTLLLTFCVATFSFGQDLIITGVIDGPLSGGTPKALELYVVNDIADLSIYGVESVTNGNASADAPEYTFPADAVTAGTFIYLESVSGTNPTAFSTFFGFSSTYQDGVLSVNGDDPIKLYMNGNAIDVYGSVGTDGSGEPWEYLDGWSYRKDGNTASNVFTVDDWIYSGPNALDGESTNASASNPFPAGTYSETASTVPSLSFGTPSNDQVFPSTTTTVQITFNVENFTLSGDNGSGGSDGSGDGYILGTSVENGGTPENINIFTTSQDYENLMPGDEVTLTAELVDNSGNSLSPAVTATVSFSVGFPCDLELGAINTVCETATTNAVDDYTANIQFIAGGTATYTITVTDGSMNPVGNLGGDDPSNVSSGTITISGIPEGTDIEVNIVGDATSSCDLTRNISSPICYPLPIEEFFNSYAANANLIDNPLWQDASTPSTPNDIQVVANDDGGGNLVLGNFYAPSEFPDPSGNMISMAGGGGSDPFIGFEEVVSGTIYASFLMHVTDFTGVGDDDGGYFAVFTENGSFRGRLWVRDDTADTSEEGLTYNLGISTASGSVSTLHTGFTANLAEPVFVVMAYDLDNDEFKLWTVPDATTFGTNTPPTADVTLTDATADGINRFLFRQDSSNETPAMSFEDLRIGTTWAFVTPPDATASVGDNQINGFKAYPNPVKDGGLTVTTNSTDTKNVDVFNVLGRRVFTQSFNGTQETLNVSNLSSGIYILKVTEGTKVSTQKLIIE